MGAASAYFTGCLLEPFFRTLMSTSSEKKLASFLPSETAAECRNSFLFIDSAKADGSDAATGMTGRLVHRRCFALIECERSSLKKRV